MRAVAAMVVSALCLLGPVRAQGAEERITDYASRIVVHADATMTVTETVSVIAARDKINRGIYREFPTTYKDRHGNTVRVGFQVVEVLRDGRSEPYHVESGGNGKRIYIGDKDVFLKPGPYTYTIAYKTDRQLGFFEGFDELYWNVTGSGWAFPIDHASAVVILPDGAEVLDTAAYTGPQGATGGDFTAGRDAAGNATFTTTRGFGPREGLTIAVSWPKGHVAAPTTADRTGYLLSDNLSLMLALAALAVLFVYYLWAWNKVGRDPEKGTIIPLFAPPENFSPAAVRFVSRMGFDQKAFAAAVVNMAVKGYLTITEDSDGDFTLSRHGADRAALSLGERRLADKLFGGATTVELKQKNHKTISAGIKALRTYLKAEFEQAHFLRNRRYFLTGLAITVLGLGASVAGASEPAIAGFMVVWLSMWTFACYFLVASALGFWLRGELIKAVPVTLFATPFLGGEVFGLFAFSQGATPATAGILVVTVLVNATFYHLLRAPTLRGRAAMDRIEGFKQFLGVAEQDRLEALTPPQKTPELFEKYLPYAMALDVENAWGEQFADVLSAAGTSGEYRPSWYHGGHWHGRGVGAMATNLGGAFSSAISSSSSAPGSSSGSGGGGSSGGGGGGGGGGGW